MKTDNQASAYIYHTTANQVYITSCHYIIAVQLHDRDNTYFTRTVQKTDELFSVGFYFGINEAQNQIKEVNRLLKD